MRIERGGILWYDGNISLRRKIMASSRTSTKKKNSKNKKSSDKRTETYMSLKVNGKEVKHPVRKFFIALCMIMLPLVGGSVITIFTIDAQEAFGSFTQPPLAPPAWLFPVVWTILYIMMGVASYLIYRVKAKKPAEKRLRVAELIVFYVQLAFNFAWTLLFFNANLKYFAFGWLIVMWSMILVLIIMCSRNQRTAMWLLLPYLLWCTFAAYLNLAIAVLN